MPSNLRKNKYAGHKTARACRMCKPHKAGITGKKQQARSD